MEVQFRRSVISGRLRAMPSIAYSHRALIAASLAPDQSVLSNLSQSPEVQSTISACRQFGSDIVTDNGVADVFGGDFAPPKTLDCGASNSTLKLFMGLSAFFEEKIEFKGEEALSVTPIPMHLAYLQGLGAKVENDNGFLPATIQGPIEGTQFPYLHSLGTQMLSGMLMASPLLPTDTEIAITGNFPTRNSLDATIDVMQRCGIEFSLDDPDLLMVTGGQSYAPLDDFAVPGGISLSSYLLLAAALCGRLIVEGVPKAEGLEKAFKAFHVDATSQESSFFAGAGVLEGAEIDASSLGEYLLHAVVLGSAAHGETRITNLPSISKRSNIRLRLLIKLLARMGANINESEHSLLINGTLLKGAEIDPEGDARVAMAISAAALSAEGGSTMRGAECANSLYPGFYGALSSIGGIVRETQQLQ
ncbi:MAG: hypothetical protein NTV88_05605 [Candidatus Micrarchaeota archaeon]|nr:hypothetical protein [Candidatus Micrarchaeota archaeon]